MKNIETVVKAEPLGPVPMDPNAMKCPPDVYDRFLDYDEKAFGDTSHVDSGNQPA